MLTNVRADKGLEAFWRRVRLELLTLAEGATARFDKSSPSADRPPGPPPAGQELRQLERRWDGCKTDDDRREVLDAALDVLRQHRLPKPSIHKKRDTDEWRRAIAADPRPSRTVARMYDVSHTSVLRFRREFGPAA